MNIINTQKIDINVIDFYHRYPNIYYTIFEILVTTQLFIRYSLIGTIFTAIYSLRLTNNY